MKVDYRRKKRRADLTVEEKISITTDYNAGMSQQDICKKYNISRMSIYRALHTMVKEEEEKVKCGVCGKVDDETVKERICGYLLEVKNEQQKETICDDCEQDHLLKV